MTPLEIETDHDFLRAWLHVHAQPHAPDATLTVEQAVEAAREARIDLLSLTGHESTWPEEELARLAGPDGPLLLPACELSMPDCHLVIHGPLPPHPRPTETAALIEAAHRAGAVVVLAHPFDLRFQLPAEWIATLGVDAVEAFNRKGRRPTSAQLAALRRTGLPLVAGLDAHQRSDIGPGFLCRIEAPVRNLSDLVAALRSGLVFPVDVEKCGDG